MEPHEQSTPTAEHNTWKSIILPGIRNFLIGVVALGAVLSLLAGTLNYWQGWVFTILFIGLTTTEGIYLAIINPVLLTRRKQVAQAGQSMVQRIFIVIALLSDLCLIVFSALDYRFGWSRMSPFVSLIGDGLIVLSFIVYYFVYRVNSFAATTIRTFEDQKVISTGPYAYVRHPKYVGDLFLVIGIPIALGSWWGLVFLVLTVLALAWRILDEEKLLKKELPGYVEYTQKVRFRLVPYIW
jgi:protein-S-isoprenylcysteine O-methyltransferase Ste14